MQVSGAGKSSSSPAGQPRTTNVLDSMTMSSRKPTPLGSTSKQGKAPVLKPLAPKPKSKVQCVAQIQMFSSPAGSHTLSDPIKLTPSSVCHGWPGYRILSSRMFSSDGKTFVQVKCQRCLYWNISNIMFFSQCAIYENPILYIRDL